MQIEAMIQMIDGIPRGFVGLSVVPLFSGVLKSNLWSLTPALKRSFEAWLKQLCFS